MDSSGLVAEVLKRRAYLLIFILSGFCGLIYESIWTHYLKLFLGHAAYAQTLVLAIFMGGMAVGSWLASRLTPRWSSPLLAYAIVEVLIGLMALVFHRVFVGLTDWSYDTVIPALDGPVAIELWKWGLAALLILPQSVLLGATFPFMSAGLARRFPRDPGRLIAGLYFANSLGAAAGILTSGFLLIAWVGLPGTIMTAGLLNILVALLVYVMVRLEPWAAAPGAVAARAAYAKGNPALPVPVGALLLVSALTGLASFIYEIGWIRMLSLVLGSSTHAFELMLSAFILGLAIGGFWVRRRVDHFEDPVRALAIIQVVMGVLAIGTLVMYQQTFSAMSFAMQALQRTEQGYALFNLFSHGIALAVMLPATICAGMTLPIITWLLMTRGQGESAIGRVYAANTVGAIAGVVLAVQWLMPVFGLKWLLIIGGAVDISLGIWLLGRGQPVPWRGRAAGTAAAAIACVLAVAVLVQLDIANMASGVFMGRGLLSAQDKIVFHRDGKTATVDVVDQKTAISIRTNGKVDAGLLKDTEAASADEATMVLCAAIPLMTHPGVRTAAVIGLGSGMSTDTLLAHPALERVDTIEIEPAMVEGARLLGPKVERTFTDPRSQIHIADAKTFFTRHRQTFDLIMSEPSNPWVSGVAGLFSIEFYQRVQRHLNTGGLFAQWFNAYHTDMTVLASVAGALGRVFPEYRLYATSGGDVLFLASTGPLPPARLGSLAGTPVLSSVERAGIRSEADLAWALIGEARTLRPLFESYAVPANSDYFPFVDLNAVHARYLGSNVTSLQELATGFANADTLDVRWQDPGPGPAHPLGVVQRARAARELLSYWQRLEAHEDASDLHPSTSVLGNLLVVRLPIDAPQGCGVAAAYGGWVQAIGSLATTLDPYLPGHATAEVWQSLRDGRCITSAPAQAVNWLDLLLASAQRRDEAVIEIGGSLLPASGAIADSPANRLLVTRILRAHLRLGRMAEALSLWRRFAGADGSIEIRAMAAYAYANS